MKTREELIQDYLDQQLTAEDQIQFDELYQHDAHFQQEVASQQSLYAVLEKRLNSKEEDLRASLQTARASLAQERGKVVSFKKWLIPIAVAACLLIIGRLVFDSSTYYELPAMQSEIVRGQEDPEALSYENAVKAFNDDDYDQSATILKALITEHPDVLQYQYYYGLSLLGKKEFGSATDLLIPLAEGESVFRDDALYYLAIAYIELKQAPKAIECIQRISPDTHGYSKAQKLLKRLK